MASLVRNSSGIYSIRFRVGSQRFNRSLETARQREAQDEKARIEKTIRRIKEGELDLPETPTPEQLWSFIRSGGRRTEAVAVAKPISFDELIEEYFEAVPEGAKEESSLKTERTHTKNLKRHLRAGTPLYDLDVRRLQSYINRRQRDAGHRGRSIRPDTIKKELQTFRQLWTFATARGYIAGKCPVGGVVLPKRDERPQFKTWFEIESILARSGYDTEETRALWDCLFLRDDEIENLLSHVKATAAHGFIHPMFALAAYTGARRSEIIRSEIGDLRLDEGYIVIREKKRRTDARISFRDISLHPRLKGILTDWLKDHPGGRWTIAIPPRVARSGRGGDTPQPLTENQAHDHFQRALADSKWAVLRGFHVLRHSFASNLARKGIHESIIDSWMGHQTEEMRRRYRHLFPDEKRLAMEAMMQAAQTGGKPSA